jgi:hypothetical protein
MANIAKIQTVSALSSKEEIIEVEYDFAVDGGAVGVLNLVLAGEDMVVVDCYAKVITACTSGGSATLIAGVAGDTDACIASTAVAALTAGAVIIGAASTMPVKLASAGYVLMTIGTAAFTAGKIKFVLKLAQFA